MWGRRGWVGWKGRSQGWTTCKDLIGASLGSGQEGREMRPAWRRPTVYKREVKNCCECVKMLGLSSQLFE